MTQSRSPLLIAQIDTPHTSRGGDFFYRTLSPGRAMAQADGVYVLSLDNIHRRRAEIMRAADVLILNAVCDADLLPILHQRRAERRLTVYEINDDVSAIPPWNPVHSFFARQDRRLLFRRLGHRCDAVQYSTGELRRLYGHLNQRGQVFPNQLERTHQRREPGAATGALVVGWGGSLGHLEDMASVAGPLKEWVRARPQVQLHLMAPAVIVALFAKDLPPGQLRVTAPGPIEHYYRFLRTLDIGLAPLLDTGFNRSRSDVKFIEYAGHGVVPLLQDSVPYIDSARPAETALLFRDPTEMVRLLDLMADDPALRRRVAGGALRYVAQERLIQDHVGDRLQFYRQLLQDGGHAARPEEEVSQRFREIATCEGAELNGRHGLLLPGRYEGLLYQGLVLSEQEGGRAEAAARFRAAVELEPGNYQPQLCLGTTLKSREWLQKAVRSGPRSIQAQLALGMNLLQQGEGEGGSAMGPSSRDGGLSSLLAAMELDPEYEIPYLCAAHALRQMGQGAEALRFEHHAASLMEPLYTAGAKSTSP